MPVISVAATRVSLFSLFSHESAFSLPVVSGFQAGDDDEDAQVLCISIGRIFAVLHAK